MVSSAVVPVAEYVRRVPPSLRPTLQAARRAIKALAPKGTRETAYRSWPIRYSVDDLYVLGLGSYPRWVSLFFFRGGALDDPDGVLEGSGKLMRHIKLREPADAERAAVRRLVREAFRRGGTTMSGATPGAARQR